MKGIMLWVFILPPREGLFVIILCLFPRGLEWFLLVTKNNSLGVSRGSTHGEANDKCINELLKRMTSTITSL